MTSERGVQVSPSTSRSGRDDKNDLGFPVEGDPEGFARAFAAAMARERDSATNLPLNRRDWADTDDLGLPSESNPGDFACAFFAVRDRRLSVSP
jgi:hypothetical protein